MEFPTMATASTSSTAALLLLLLLLALLPPRPRPRRRHRHLSALVPRMVPVARALTRIPSDVLDNFTRENVPEQVI